jgi:hypothetical protein
MASQEQDQENQEEDREGHSLEYLERTLNDEIGFHYFKHYITMLFWGYIAMPINGAITIMSALTTGQATTSTFLSHDVFFNITIATLSLSAINTYIQPQTQLHKNAQWKQQWTDLGMQFEELFYAHQMRLEDKHVAYETLLRQCHQLEREQLSDETHFMTDMVFWGIHRCMSKSKDWIAQQTQET